MTNENAIKIGRLHIRQALNLTPTTYKILALPASGMPSRIVEFRTEEGSTVEVRIRPRTGKILSKAVDADGHATFHSASFMFEDEDDKGNGQRA